MLFSPSIIRKISLFLLTSLVVFYIFMDCNLYMRLQYYPIGRGVYDHFNYNDISWLGYNISPLADITVKGVLLDHTNLYLFGPIVKILDNLFNFSNSSWITPNAVSFFHVFVAVASGKFISSDSISHRRIGALLFEFRTFLDDVDGHIARVRNHVKGERSEVGATGYFIDGICDGLGTIALILGSFIFLRNTPHRRGYASLPIVVENKETIGNAHKAKSTMQSSIALMACFTAQLLIDSISWNRYIAIYQDLLEDNNVSMDVLLKQLKVFESTSFFIVAWLWRIVNVHNMVHCFLLAICCDKMQEFINCIQYLGFILLFSVILFTELHAYDALRIIHPKLTNFGAL